MSSSNDLRARELNRLKLALATFALHLDAFEERTHGMLRSMGRSQDGSLSVGAPRKGDSLVRQ